MDDQGWDEVHKPPHRLVITAAATAPLVTFVPEPGLGQVRREWAERRLVVPEPVAVALALTVGESMVVRSMHLFVGGDPVLTSSTYLPAYLAGSSNTWQRVDAGQLALTEWPAESSYLQDRWRMPRQVESTALGIEPRTPVLEMARPYTVRVSASETVPAGVLVVARSDLVAVRHESGS